MRAVARQAAFEQRKLGHFEWVADQALATLEEIFGLAGAAAFPASERDVRVEGPALGLEPNALASALDLCCERGERILWLDPRPQRAGIARLEAPNALDPDRKRR